MKLKVFFTCSFVHLRHYPFIRINAFALYLVIISSFFYDFFFAPSFNEAQENPVNTPPLKSTDGPVSSKVTGIVIVNKSNIRNEPTTTSMIILQLPLWETVTILEEKEDWLRVETSGNHLGWIHTSLILRLSPDQSVESALLEKKIKHRIVLKVPTGRVREQPSPDAPIKFRLYQNDIVTVIDVENDWKHIALDDGRNGWAHQRLFYPMDQTSSAPVVDNRQISDIRTQVKSETEEWALFMLNGFFTPEIFVVGGEKPQVVCDFSGISLGNGFQHPIELNTKLIKQIHILPENKIPLSLRIVLDLSPEYNYHVQPVFYQTSNQYVIVIKSKE